MDVASVPNTGVGIVSRSPIIDMGAYEHQGVEKIEGDLTGDGKVDMADLAVLAGNWLAGT